MAAIQAKVSVVIPTYNRAALLPRAIASVQAQSVDVAEIIVIDDGSSDDTLTVLRSLATTEPRLQVVERARGGANRARNAGVEAANGEWIAFLDSDDHWMPRKLEHQLAALAATPSAIAAFAGLMMHAPHRTAVFIPNPRPTLMDLRCCNALSSTSSAVISAAQLREVGGFDPDLPSCQDWDLWYRLRQIGPFVVVQEPLVHIDGGQHQRITSDREKVAEGHEILFARLCEGLAPGPQLRKVQAAHQLVLADIDRRAGDYAQSLPLALKSCLRSPSLSAFRSVAQNISGAMRQALTGM